MARITDIQFKQVLDLLETDKKDKEISQETGVGQGTISVFRSCNNRLKRGETFKNKTWFTNRVARVGGITVRQKPEEKQDSYDILSQSFVGFTEAITKFIEGEVAKQVAQTVKENEKLKETVKRLQEENDAYQTVFLEAKNSNWIDTLRKRLEHKTMS